MQVQLFVYVLIYMYLCVWFQLKLDGMVTGLVHGLVSKVIGGFKSWLMIDIGSHTKIGTETGSASLHSQVKSTAWYDCCILGILLLDRVLSKALPKPFQNMASSFAGRGENNVKYVCILKFKMKPNGPVLKFHLKLSGCMPNLKCFGYVVFVTAQMKP